MNNTRLRSDLALVMGIEAAAQTHVRAMIESGDLMERNAALVVARQATSLRRELEKWIVARAVRVPA